MLETPSLNLAFTKRLVTVVGDIDDRVKQAAADIDPRRAFARLNPAGFAPEDLEFSDTGFIDKYAQSSYVQFLAGYNAALGVAQ